MNGQPQQGSGHRLVEAIEAKGLTNHQVALELGVSDRSVTGWRSGERGPKMTEAQALAKLLNQPALPGWWLWPSETPKGGDANPAAPPPDGKPSVEDDSVGGH